MVYVTNLYRRKLTELNITKKILFDIEYFVSYLSIAGKTHRLQQNIPFSTKRKGVCIA